MKKDVNRYFISRILNSIGMKFANLIFRKIDLPPLCSSRNYVIDPE